MKIGQTMTMVLGVKDDENKFDMMVRNCVAHDGSRYRTSKLYYVTGKLKGFYFTACSGFLSANTFEGTKCI